MNKKYSNVIISVVFGSLVFLITIFFLLNSQLAARKLGGNTTIVLDKGRQVEEVTWKDNSIWILTKERYKHRPPEKHTFSEYSVFGVLQGTVTIIEK